MPRPDLHQQLEVEPHPNSKIFGIADPAGLSVFGAVDLSTETSRYAAVKNIEGIQDETQLIPLGEREELFQPEVKRDLSQQSL